MRMGRYFSFLLACAVIGMAAPCLAQSGTQSKPMKIIVPAGPGGTPDTVARILAQKLSVGLDRAIVIENMVGTAGAINSALATIKAPADGDTLLFADTGLSALPA